jgi:hypothetical protein
MKTVVTLPHGASTANLRFAISEGEHGEPTTIPYFAVESCPAAFFGPSVKYWQFEMTADPVRITDVAYGVTPAGYTTKVSPRALPPNGCYVATVGGLSQLFFVADSAGSIATITQEEAKRRSHQQ